jgi:hypothetical protein
VARKTSQGKGAGDRFGMREGAIRAAIEGHRGVLRAGMYVPTREEVATWPPETLYSIVMDWMWESPSEIIPNKDQIAEVLAILEARPDADEHMKLIAECREYLKV